MIACYSALQMELLPLSEETQTLLAWRLRFSDARFQAGFLDASWLAPWLLQVAGLLLGWRAGWLGHELPFLGFLYIAVYFSRLVEISFGFR